MRVRVCVLHTMEEAGDSHRGPRKFAGPIRHVFITCTWAHVAFHGECKLFPFPMSFGRRSQVIGDELAICISGRRKGEERVNHSMVGSLYRQWHGLSDQCSEPKTRRRKG